MDLDQSLKRILSAHLSTNYPANAFSPETPLLGAIPELDSMAVVAILESLEEELGISIVDDEISAEVFATFGALLAFVSN